MKKNDELTQPKQPCRRYIAAAPGPTDEEIALELLYQEDIEEALSDLRAEREAPEI